MSLFVSMLLPHRLHGTPPVFLRSLQMFELESTRGRCGHTLAAALSLYSAGPCSPLCSPLLQAFFGLSSNVKTRDGRPSKRQPFLLSSLSENRLPRAVVGRLQVSPFTEHRHATREVPLQTCFRSSGFEATFKMLCRVGGPRIQGHPCHTGV